MEKDKFLKLLKRLKESEIEDDTSSEYTDVFILESFKKLSDKDKIELLNRLIKNDTPEETIDSIVRQLGRKSPTIEELNQIELIHLKSWLIKSIIIAVFIGFLIFIAVMVYFTGHDSATSLSDYFEDFIKMFNLIILNKS